MDVIDNHLLEKGVLAASFPEPSTALSYFECPYQLTASLAALYPKSIDVVYFDCPRSSSKVSARLIARNGNSITVGDYDETDLSFEYYLKSSLDYSFRKIHKLLSNKGLLLVSVSPRYSGMIRNVADQVFGAEAYIGELVYQSRSGGGSDSNYMSLDHEYLIIYAKEKKNIRKFNLKKTKKELERYKYADPDGTRFAWDTFIRKQARNYYPIKCPDGKTLKLDEHGNKISWLWAEKTFLDKKRIGDIEFRKIKGKWRIFYKDKLKEFKILRSLVLHGTLLNEVNGSGKPGKGSDLLNSMGSSEIKEFTCDKPEYLKPSTFYSFIFDTFVSKNENVYIPFSEYGSGIIGFNDACGDHNNRILVNNTKNFEKLIKRRCSKLKLISFNSQKRLKLISPFDFLDSSGFPPVSLVNSLIAGISGIKEFKKDKIDKKQVFVGIEADRVALVYYNDNRKYMEGFNLKIDNEFCQLLENKFGKKNISIYAPGVSMARELNSLLTSRIQTKLIPFCLFN
jgi:hypothetical protein